MDAYLGEVRVFPYGYVPKGWAACDGTKLPIPQFTALYSLIGTQFGGDGRTNFALPDYRGNIPVSMGTVPGGSVGWVTGMTYGTNGVALTQDQMPMHNHGLMATTASATTATAAGNQLGYGQQGTRGSSTTANIYSAGGVDTQLGGGSILPTGNGAAHNNQMPYLGLQICICMNGFYPSRP